MSAKLISRSTFFKIRKALAYLYGAESVEPLAERLYMLLGRYQVMEKGDITSPEWTQNDVVLITYADMIQEENATPLSTLKKFCDTYLSGAISSVHLLPFYPSSSDGGFSVIDYRKVNPSYGSWKDIAQLKQNYGLMFDLVLNHCSRKSQWFKDYVAGIAPQSSYIQEGNPEADLSKVVRPRPTPLLTETETNQGLKHIWNTFSFDQVDLNWKNPDVLFEFLDILLFYISQGSKIVRLDAVAFLWKEDDSTCIHLKQTHEVIKLMRNVLKIVAPDVILLTETNVPHEENVSYFGQGDEAHMVYQFALPPLLVHGLLKEDASYLKTWLSNLKEPPAGCTFFNFTASHDGIGLRPVSGLIPDNDVLWMVEEVKKRKGKVGMRSMPDGSEKPYEMNITYFDALSDLEDETLGFKRFLLSQAIAISLKGIPGVYFHSLVGENNWVEGSETLTPRDINRRRWDFNDLSEKLSDRGSKESSINTLYTNMLRIRKFREAFHPEASQELLASSNQLFVLLRKSANDAVLCLFSFSSKPQQIDLKNLQVNLDQPTLRNLLTGEILDASDGKLTLGAFEFMWIG